MNLLKGFFLVALIYGSTAIPTPEEDVSVFFNNADPEAKIVGGTQAPVGSHPHMVAFTAGFFLRTYQCGGSIVTSKHILTAAHCIGAWFRRGSLNSSLRATVGTNTWNSGGERYQIASNITHPNYVLQTIKNDIGFLITRTTIQFTARIQPVPLSYNFIEAGVPTRVAGWGRIRAGGAISPTLLQIFTSTIDGQRCVIDARESMIANGFRNPPPVEPHIEVCTFHSTGVGNCNGDSGSALTRSADGAQIGIVSWGIPCAVGGPDMYARISPYENWIRNIIE